MSTKIEDDLQIPSSGSAPAGSVDLVLAENSQGDVVLPREIYNLIAPQLPLCLQRGDDDRCSTPHYPPKFLKTESESTVTLHTRNTFLAVQLLDQMGFRVRLHRSFNFPSCIQPDNSLLGITKSNDKDIANTDATLLTALANFRAGKIVSCDSQRKFDVAATVCKLFSSAPIVFVVASRAEGELAKCELKKRLSEDVHFARGVHAKPECRITVATYVAARSIDLCDAPFVIVPHWRPGFPLWMKQLTWNPWLDRIYFLLTAAEVNSLSNRETDDLAGRVGPIIFQPESAPRGITTFSTFRFGGKVAENDRRLPNAQMIEAIDSRTLYWRHRPRNQAIAAIGREMDGCEGTVAILVENGVHARQLSQLLPDWPVVRNGTIPTNRMARMIITLSAANSWPDFQPDCVLVGMGGRPSAWLLESAERLNQNGKSIRVIDLIDGFDDLAGRLALSRQTVYRNAGWHWRPLDNSLVRSVGRMIRMQKKSQKSF